MLIIMAEDEKYQIILQELVRRTNDGNSRLRGLEQRLQSLEERVNNFEENILLKTSKTNDKFLTMEATIRNLADDLLTIKNTLEKINRQVMNFATKKEIKEVERMFDLLNPIRQEFLTKDDLEEELENR